MSEPICKTCKYYITMGKDTVCNRYPPQVRTQQYVAGLDGPATNIRVGPISGFPQVQASWYCGEWRDLEMSKWDDYAERTYPNHPF